MNAIRKIGAWLWNSKERMVLAVMVVVLCYRVYQVVNPPLDDENQPVFTPPSNDPKGIVPPPPPPPVPFAPPTENWSLIWRRSSWQWQPRTDRRDQNAEAELSINLELLDIMELPNGRVRAQIKSVAGSGKWYDEGDPFESYTLISIDPDTNSCVIFAEVISRNIELFIE